MHFIQSMRKMRRERLHALNQDIAEDEVLGQEKDTDQDHILEDNRK